MIYKRMKIKKTSRIRGKWEMNKDVEDLEHIKMHDIRDGESETTSG